MVVHELRDRGVPVKPLRPDKDKVARAQYAAGRIGAGKVFFPRHGSFQGDLENELLASPNSRHDDQVDVIAYAVAQVKKTRPKFTNAQEWSRDLTRVSPASDSGTLTPKW